MSKNYSKSKFAILHTSPNNEHFLFNSFNGALARINAERLESVRDILSNPNSTSRSREELSLQAQMVAAGFLLDGNVDELSVAEMRFNLQRFSSETLNLTIMPNLSCNFSCAYCYESLSHDHMKEEVSSSLVSFVDKKLATASKLTVGWFGGEPLLDFELMGRLSKFFLASCTRHSAKYAATITTNGYLLTRNVVERLDEIGVTGIQVTLDGSEQVHDSRRTLRSGGPTFHRIVANLVELVESNPRIAVWIRVNCDEQNIDTLDEFWEEIPEKLLRHCDIYFATVYGCCELENRLAAVDLGPTSATVRRGSKAFRERLMELQLKSANRGKTNNEKPVISHSFQPKWFYCGANKSNSFVVDPLGNLHKCTVSFSENTRIGHLRADGSAEYDLKQLSKWLGVNPFSREKCRNCGVLPLCLGGCQSAYLAYPHQEFCATLFDEEDLGKGIEAIAKQLRQRGVVCRSL